MSLGPLAATEILHACLDSGSEADWTAFVRRFQPLIAATVTGVVRRYGGVSPAQVDDLIQETYLRLCRDNFRSLREFRPAHDEALFGFLKVVARSVALDHYRARSTHKRRGETADDGSNLDGSMAAAGIERLALLGEVERRLETTESERDRTIFWLYYGEGHTAKEIAAMPELELTQKGVESCIYRLTQTLRSVMAARSSGFAKGSSSGNALGRVE